MKVLGICAALTAVALVACTEHVESEEERAARTASAMGCFVCPEHDSLGGGMGPSVGGGGRPSPPCPPNTDCVEVHRERIPSPRVNVDGPRERPPREIPGVGGGDARVSTIGAKRVSCKGLNMVDCQYACLAVGAACPTFHAHPHSGAVPSAVLAGCKGGAPTYTCSYNFANGDACTGIFLTGGWEFSMLCAKG